MVRKIFARLKFLTTGRAVWVDTKTDKRYVTRETWQVRWAVAGIHSHNWWWVNKYGARDCGCTINPLTRRTVLFDIDCEKHMGLARESK